MQNGARHTCFAYHMFLVLFTVCQYQKGLYHRFLLLMFSKLHHTAIKVRRSL